jgi:ribosome-binding ATPase YchF (GTP1/OBG family)
VNETLLLGKPARIAGLNDEELEMIKSLMLLTLKPVIYAANVADSDLAKGQPAISFHFLICATLA